jgi:ring-1,2-phenylacetyl-CoA epoxidase subunit PaaD
MRAMVAEIDSLEKRVWEILETIEDPELPVTITDLGLIREVEVDGRHVRVTMLPTFSACPAIGVMREDIRRRVGAIPEVDEVDVELSFAEPWTMARMTERGRERLFNHGVSVPGGRGEGEGPSPTGAGGTSTMGPRRASEITAGVNCPFCGSTNTRLENPFGPTLCRAIYYCVDCKNPIERFRPPGGVEEAAR